MEGGKAEDFVFKEHSRSSADETTVVQSRQASRETIVKDGESETKVSIVRAHFPTKYDNQIEYTGEDEEDSTDEEQAMVNQQLQSELGAYIKQARQTSKVVKHKTENATVEESYRATWSRSSTETPDSQVVQSCETDQFMLPTSPQNKSITSDKRFSIMSPRQKRRERRKQLRRQLEQFR
ncbi:hypothetical protein H2198_003049 [Neophaeococcomyces mojaviensis]|uniref:Uncharacterized protein n=1 Tax=Neophaeococcomyces mojaviensis TaxID=3383035 RepID=A0ACC3AD69_9EURO|nr:hypothetical protein H2198_003049 [Knufia sp. JES_112]